MDFWRKYILHSPVHYLVALLLCAGLTVVVLFLRGFDQKIYYVDAFSVAGAIVILLGLLFQVASAGAFDTVAYGFSTFRADRRYKDLYEYTRQKQEKRSRQKKIFMPYVVVGLAFLAVSWLCGYF